jgi:folate-binding protein YgfZ
MKSTLQAIEVKGKKAEEFLNGISTKKVAHQSLNVFCNEQGKVLALALIVAQGENTYWVCVDQSLVSNMVKHFEFYGRFSRVKVMAIDGLINVNRQAQMVDHAKDEAGWLDYQFEQGLPFLDESTSAKYTPQMLGYDAHGLIDWEKGCYLGQEVVTRISHLGKNKRHLHRVMGECEGALVLKAPKGTLMVLNESQAEALGDRCSKVTQL